MPGFISYMADDPMVALALPIHPSRNYPSMLISAMPLPRWALNIWHLASTFHRHECYWGFATTKDTFNMFKSKHTHISLSWQSHVHIVLVAFHLGGVGLPSACFWSQPMLVPSHPAYKWSTQCLHSYLIAMFACYSLSREHCLEHNHMLYHTHTIITNQTSKGTRHL